MIDAVRARAATRAVALGALAALLAVFIAWHVARFSAATAGLACGLGVAPWLALAPGLWRGDPKRLTVGLLLTTPYLGYGLMEVLANPGARGFAAATVLLAFALAVALAAALRVSRPAAAARP